MSAAQIAAAYATGHQKLHDVSVSWQTAVQHYTDRKREWATNTVHAGPMPLGERQRYLDWARARDPEVKITFDELVPVPPTVTDPPPPSGGLDIPLFCQRNSPWSGIRLGASAHTVGARGCAMVAATMRAWLVDNTLDPGKVVTWLNANGGFTSTGNLYWAKVAQMVNGLQFADYYTWRDAGQVANMTIVRRELAKGPVVIQVDFIPGTTQLDSHFVLALREVNGDIEFIDPWTGTKRWLKTSYWRGSLETSIFALVEYRTTTVAATTPTPTTTHVVNRIWFEDWVKSGGSWSLDRRQPGVS